jgi:hypothetical protein
MGLLDNILETVKKGVEVAREKGEMGVNVARLRLEMANLGRERDGFYQRLGKMYVQSPNDHAMLDPLVDEIKRISNEIENREQELSKIGDHPEPAGSPSDPAIVPPSPAEASPTPVSVAKPDAADPS